ncbi:hypothetical protein JW877_03650 [bacterium]|nr:hypothetical protein [bacterium]
MKKFIMLVPYVVIIAGFLLTMSCTFDYKGEEKPNQAPNIILANSPPDSAVVSSAPIIWWYAPDIDGWATLYRWVDISINSVDEATYRAYQEDPSIIPAYMWVEVESVYSDTIYLSHDTVNALADPPEPTEHLFCIRAIDDDADTSSTTCVIIYRTNIPPTNMKILAHPFEEDTLWEGLPDEALWDTFLVDTLWCLDYTTYSWSGLTFVWDADDLDDPVIMEYYWAVVDYDDRGNIVQCSGDPAYHYMDDGVDTLDGWITSSSVTLTNLENGSYVFYIKARDDAFFESERDSMPMTIISPIVDVSDTNVLMDWINGDMDFNVLLIDATNSNFLSGIWDPVADSVQAFYTDMMNMLEADGLIDSWDLLEAPDNFPNSGSSQWRIPMRDLAEHNIIYWVDGNATDANTGLTLSIADQLGGYIEMGGRLIMDGRRLMGSSIGSNDYYSFASRYMGLCAGGLCYSGGFTNPSFSDQYFGGAVSVFPNVYPSLYPDPDRAPSSATPGIVPAVGRLYPRQPAYGMPYSRVVYIFDCHESINPATPEYQEHQNDGVAIEYVTPSFRSAIYEFGFYFMKNEDNNGNGIPDVEEAIKKAFDFIKTPPVLQEEEE